MGNQAPKNDLTTYFTEDTVIVEKPWPHRSEDLEAKFPSTPKGAAMKIGKLMHE
jgi:hypothetical protein